MFQDLDILYVEKTGLGLSGVAFKPALAEPQVKSLADISP